jgi:PAS domain S-box-containing protein
LRRSAEGRLGTKQAKARESSPDASVPPRTKEPGKIPDATERLVHELEVHQIELEMQNEELRRATETLEAAKAEYTDLYDFAPVGYFTFDGVGVIRRLNLTGARLLGVERSSAVRNLFEAFVAEEDRGTFRRFLGQVFTGTERHSCEVAIEARGPREVTSGAPLGPVQVRIAATLSAGRQECRALAMDVTEQTRAVRALQESELRFRTLVEAMEDSVITTDRRGRVTSVHSKRLESLASSPATLVGKSAAELYGGEVEGDHDVTHARVLAGETVAFEWKQDIGGERLDMQTIASPLRDANGQITGSLDVSRDVTELKRLHEQVLLAERMSSLGILAAGVAHEINNPLTVVIANLDATLEQCRVIERSAREVPPYLAEMTETIEDCLAAADRVREIVSNLKVFSRPDEVSRSPVDLRAVVRLSLKLIKNDLRYRATLVTEYGDVPLVLGNEARLGQVVLNLLVNAAQSMPEGQDEQNTITVRTRTHRSGCALLEICDTGPGIPDDVMEHIFEPFFTTKPIGVGTGLGLAICRQIVTGFGGEIAVDSELGKGTRFRVFLPAHASGLEDRAERPHALEPAAPSGRRGRILLVDDDPEVLGAIARTLSARHDVIPVLRAREALARIAAGDSFDLVISDVMMPEMTGMELYEALEEIAPHHARSMIFLSGGAFTPRARAFITRVDNLCFDKPFDRQSLLTLVDRFVG